MIRSEREYQDARQKLVEDRDFAEVQRAALVALDLTPDEVERAMEPLNSFTAQLAEEVDWYERVSRGEIGAITRLTDVGRVLIALRIANGLTQREMAEKLGVNEAQVSRDERNEYRGISVERAQRVLDVLQEKLTARIEDRSRLVDPDRGLVAAR